MSSGQSDPYAQSGVNIEAGNALVEAIRPAAASTRRPGVMGGLGGFGAVFDPKAAGYADPLLVAATDGVGTKLKIAIALDRHDTIGIDLVAMCVNDLVVQGAEPLFFLDYYATGGLRVEAAREVVEGVAEGCRQAGCALVGGETAELPGLYAGRDYDLAGFAVGAVERERLLTGRGVAEGDVVLGLASDGAHSNGFSLLRRIAAESGLDWDDPCPFESGRTLGAALLDPTRIYVKACLAALKGGDVKALAHITGGGLLENIPRVLPEGLGCRLDAATWPLPPVFHWAARAGALSTTDLARTFNCGLGMIAIVSPERQNAVAETLMEAGERVYRVGRIESAGAERVIIEGAETAWRG